MLAARGTFSWRIRILIETSTITHELTCTGSSLATHGYSNSTQTVRSSTSSRDTSKSSRPTGTPTQTYPVSLPDHPRISNNTQLAYAEDPVFFTYETGNDLSGQIFGDKNDPAAWTDENLTFVKTLGN